MKLHLIDDAWAVLKHAWSVRWMVAAAVCSTGEIFIPMYVDEFPRGWCAAATLVCAIAGLYFRFVKQAKLSGKHDG